MAEKFDLFRFSLLPPKQSDILAYPAPTREEFLRRIFSAPQQFTHRKTVYHYVPSEKQGDDDDVIIGRIGRSIVMEENLPPDVGLRESQHETWKASVVVIDPAEHADGQKVSFENDPQVGTTQAIMTSLINILNEKLAPAPYHIEVSPIFDASTFWEWAERNKGDVTSLTFTFVAPNMFGGIDSITAEMREFRDQEKVQRVKIELNSDEGIETDTDKIRNSVEYTTRGGGDITARAKGKKPYNSKKKTKYVIMDEIDDDEPMLVQVAKKISQVLGRE